MAEIKGTDSDLLGQLPKSPDRTKRAADAARLSSALEGLEIEDPAVLALLAHFQEQTRFVGSSEAELDSDGEAQTASGADHDTKEVAATGDSTSETAPELSPEQVKTLSTLKANHESKEAKLKTGIQWAEVEAKLQKSPEKLAVLARLIARGGEPTVTAKLSNANFRFDELSEESPTGNRDVNFDQAEALATQLGAELMEPSVYDSFRGKIALDQATWSWLRTTKEVRKTGYAFGGLYGSSSGDRETVHNQAVGMRCSLEV